MKIAFIYPPQTHKQFEEDIDIVSKEFGVFPPLGLAYAAAIHERTGNKAMIIDANAEKIGLTAALARYGSLSRTCLGSYLPHTDF